MADAPVEINRGKVIGTFVSFVADTDDPGDQPDMIDAEGSITLTPSVPSLSLGPLTPPRTAWIAQVVCPIIGGEIYPPGTTQIDVDGGTLPGVHILSTTQPSATPSSFTWTVSFNITGISPQPAPFSFTVAPSATVDLTVVTP